MSYKLLQVGAACLGHSFQSCSTTLIYEADV